MKMKDAIKATGLPEKTIRYYESRGLVTPETYRQNGRTYHEYSDKDISALKQIVVLRQAQFTLDEIHTMQQRPAAIPDILAAHHRRIQEAQDSLSGLLELKEIEADSIASLCAAISARQKQSSGYIPVLRFGQYDPETESEKAQAISDYKKKRTDPLRNYRIAILALGALCLLLAGLTIFLLSAKYSTAPISTETTEGWYYFNSPDGICRSREDGSEAELIYTPETSSDRLPFLVGERNLYVLSQYSHTLISLDPSGRELYTYKAKYEAHYANILALYQDSILAIQGESGGFGNGNYSLVLVAADGSSQKKLNVEINDPWYLRGVIWGDTLYLYEKITEAYTDTGSSEIGQIVVYDLTRDCITEILDWDPTLNVACTDESGGLLYHSGDYTDAFEDDLITDLYRCGPDCPQGEYITALDGTLVDSHGDYVIYDGDYTVTKNGSGYTAISGATYLMKLSTGAAVKVPASSNFCRISFFPQCVLFARSWDDLTRVPYPE